MEDVRYNYSINPRKRIISEFPILKNVRTPKTLMLSKREVIDALKYCIVYRRFDGVTIKKVNLMNLDRMHQATYDPTMEQEFKPISFEEDEMVEKKEETLIEKKETETIKPAPSLVEDIIKEETEPVKYNEAPAEIKTVSEEESIPVEEEIKEDAEIENQSVEYAPESIVEEQPIEVGETVEESIPNVIEPTVEFEEDKKDYTQNNNKKYYNNKKHH